MTSRHLSLRVDTELLERLERESRLTNQNRSELAKTLIDEGLRMTSHPGIVFRPGPTGRRAALVRGPDAWELVRFHSVSGLRGDEAIARTAEAAAVSTTEVRSALRYYSEFPEEIDARISSTSGRPPLATGRGCGNGHCLKDEACHRRDVVARGRDAAGGSPSRRCCRGQPPGASRQVRRRVACPRGRGPARDCCGERRGLPPAGPHPAAGRRKSPRSHPDDEVAV